MGTIIISDKTTVSYLPRQVFQTNPAFRMAEDANQSEVLPVEGANALDSNEDSLRGEERKYVLLRKQGFFFMRLLNLNNENDISEHVSLLY